MFSIVSTIIVPQPFPGQAIFYSLVSIAIAFFVLRSRDSEDSPPQPTINPSRFSHENTTFLLSCYILMLWSTRGVLPLRTQGRGWAASWWDRPRSTHAPPREGCGRRTTIGAFLVALLARTPDNQVLAMIIAVVLFCGEPASRRGSGRVVGGRWTTASSWRVDNAARSGGCRGKKLRKKFPAAAKEDDDPFFRRRMPGQEVFAACVTPVVSTVFYCMWCCSDASRVVSFRVLMLLVYNCLTSQLCSLSATRGSSCRCLNSL